MENIIKEYTLWSEAPLPAKLYQELAEISNDTEQIYDRFCRHINFGTSGLRGKMGAGPNRMNEIVIKRATMGVADYLLSKQKNSLVIIGYDTRINSKEFAHAVAEDFAMRGIDTYLFEEPTPVPVVSFAIRHLKASGGVMITASHNPKIYNGYKVYDHCGNQIDDKKARTIEDFINKRDYFEEIPAVEAQGKIIMSDGKVKEAYLKALQEHILCWTEDKAEMKAALADLNIVYTPLNGAGRDYAMSVFEHLGVQNVTAVEEQWEHDGNFPTCPSPNPENPKALTLAVEYAGDHADIVVATDPDSDRAGFMARKDGVMTRLSGDEVGILMLDYVCHCHAGEIDGKDMKGHKVAFKSLVSSPFAADVAKAYGVDIRNVPTGFKNIAKEMEYLKQYGREGDFLFGFEESLGYLYGNYTRDKDGVLACQMMCIMAAALKKKGMTLFDKMDELYEKHGYVDTKGAAIEFEQEKDRETMSKIMDDLYEGKFDTLLGQKLIIDGSTREQKMFRATLPEGHQVIIRPSGTELKIKIYAFAKGHTQAEADQNIAKIMEELDVFAANYR